MAQIYPGRYTAETDEPFVVFLIGMRFNRLWAIHKWWPIFTAMPRMLEALQAEPGSGLLGYQNFLYPGGVGVIQYWRSYEALDRFARSPDEMHLEAWKRFNRAVGADGSVGIWHETYLVGAGQYECIYGNMPRFGLAKATAHGPVVGRRETARGRLGRADERTAVPAY
jgi:hypothetical protein